ncbi:MAG: YitT family protein, partial [Oscillospiraceae bacterium]
RFLVCSFVSAGSFSLFYVLLSLTPRLWPSLSGKPLIASITGALFVGVGAGLCVRAGGAQSGDDALAMILAEKTRLSLTGAYLISDLTVLALSLTYIPPKRIVYSLITVLLSGQIIGLVQKIPCSWKKEEEAEQPAGGR